MPRRLGRRGIEQRGADVPGGAACFAAAPAQGVELSPSGASFMEREGRCNRRGDSSPPSRSSGRDHPGPTSLKSLEVCEAGHSPWTAPRKRNGRGPRGAVHRIPPPVTSAGCLVGPPGHIPGPPGGPRRRTPCLLQLRNWHPVPERCHLHAQQRPPESRVSSERQSDSRAWRNGRAPRAVNDAAAGRCSSEWPLP
jgi:hypothetical protein